MTEPQTPTGKLLARAVPSITNGVARRARRKQVRAIEVEAAAMERDRLRKEWVANLRAYVKDPILVFDIDRMLADPTP